MGSHKVRARSSPCKGGEIDLNSLEEKWKTLLGWKEEEDLEGALSVREIAEVLGLSLSGASKIVRKAVKDGRIECVGKRKATRDDGAVFGLPVYRFVQDGSS